MKKFILVLVFCFPVVVSASTTINWETTHNDDRGFGISTTNNKDAQSFTATLSGSIDFVSVGVSTQGSPSDSVQADLFVDSGGTPSGASLGTATVVHGSIPAASGGDNCSVAQTTFTFSPSVTITNGTKYWLVLSRTGSFDASNYYHGCINDPAVYSGGNGAQYTSGSWVARSWGMWGSTDVSTGGGGSVSLGGATSTLDRAEANLSDGFFVYFIAFFGMVWLLTQ